MFFHPPIFLLKSPGYLGLDIHKHYLVAVGVNQEKEEVYGPRRVAYNQLEQWLEREVTDRDAVVLEMTTNTWQMVDLLDGRVHSLTVVHPPHVALITRAQVMTDKIAARSLARLHAAGLLPSVWIPPQPVRELRALVAQRTKVTRLSTQAKNRLHAVLHRHHLALPEGDPFAQGNQSWWGDLPLSLAQQSLVQSDLATLRFAQQQVEQLTAELTRLAAEDERVPLLVQLSGIAIVAAMTILAAIGDISRFPTAKQLVGYAGLDSRVHDSGQTKRRGRITKAGRRDLRAIMVEAAQTAANSHPHWQAELNRLRPRLGRNKAIVAIARKLLVAVWHILTQEKPDRFSQPERLARRYLPHTYRLGQANRPPGQSPAAYVRQQLNRLHIGADLTEVPWGSRRAVPLPPSAPG
ncbi:MAG: IS110 family transposase [Chloroflexi bacterium]|nr:IS110 family transposase [Chloroflexota bacterium]GIK58602.1 MAG: IS110 family transposase [Chloroflexota bacterium]